MRKGWRIKSRETNPKQGGTQTSLEKDVEKGISRCDGMKKNDRMESLLLFSGYRRVHLVGVRWGWAAASGVRVVYFTGKFTHNTLQTANSSC